jgi:hypothetical protein
MDSQVDNLPTQIYEHTNKKSIDKRETEDVQLFGE